MSVSVGGADTSVYANSDECGVFQHFRTCSNHSTTQGTRGLTSVIFVQVLQSLSLPHRQLIYNYPEQLFADAGVMAIEHADFEGIERLSLVLGQQRGHTYINFAAPPDNHARSSP